MPAPRKAYHVERGRPVLRPSFVCYADILGYASLSRTAIEAGEGGVFLTRLRRALSNAYRGLRKYSRDKDYAFYSIKVFTDNVVVGHPVDHFESRWGEPELHTIIELFSHLQIRLVMEGFFLRGGISFGEHYMDDDIVFGDALLEAVEEDRSGGPPKLTLAPSAVAIVQRHLSFYNQGWAPHYDALLEDADGGVFLNYLAEAFGLFPDRGIFLDVIEAHQRHVMAGLERYRGTPDVRAKFEWAARYHNYVCRDFAERHSAATWAEGYADEYLAAMEAQRLLEYLIDIEALAATPGRLTVRPLVQRGPSEGLGE